MYIKNQVDYDIPFYSQQVSQQTFQQDGFGSFEEALSWEDRGCGIASLRMVIDGFLKKKCLPLCERHGAMIHKGLEKNAYKQNIGWIHQGLCNIAADYGIIGQAFREQTVENIQSEIEAGRPCIVSVTPRFAGGQPKEDLDVWGRGGHLIVVLGALVEDGVLKAFIVHHPSCFDGCNWNNMIVDVERFRASFSGNFISFCE